MEVREVKVKQVDERCPICGKGWMRPNGIISGQSPYVQHQHKCTNCNYVQNYPITYPYTVNE